MTELELSALPETMFSAAKDVFTSMLGIDIDRRVSEGPAASRPACEVFSIVGLTGAYTGNGFVFCAESTACDIASRFLMSPFAAVNEEVLDAMGELTNMIVGAIKNHLELHHGDMGMSVPTVVHGEHISTHHGRASHTVSVDCVYSGGDFAINLALSRS